VGAERERNHLYASISSEGNGARRFRAFSRAYNKRTEMESLTVGSETDVFAPATRVVSTQSSTFYEYHPLSAPSSSGPITFNIPGNDVHYIDPSSLQLHVRVKIQSGGKDITTDDPEVEPVNNFIHSMFEQVTVHMNENQITPTSNHYPYRAKIESKLGLNGEFQKTLGRTALFTDEEDAVSVTSEGYKMRAALAKHSGTFDMIGRPFLDICGLTKYIIPNTDLRLTFSKASTAFCLREKKSAATVASRSYNIEFLQARLCVKKVTMIPSILASHMKLLQSGVPASYPMRKVEVKSYALPQGTVQNVNETLLTGRLPDRIILALVKSEDFHGTLGSVPFNFTDFGLQNISVTVNGDSNYHKSIDVDAAGGFVIEPYYNLFSELSLDPCSEGPHITLEAFKNGNMFFVFNLNDIGGGDEFGMQRHGTIKIETKFKTGLPHPVNVICHADYQSTLLIDSNKSAYWKEQ
jgi:hypothetical protein